MQRQRKELRTSLEQAYNKSLGLRTSSTNSVPKLDDAVPTGRGNLGSLMRMPQSGNAHVIVGLELGVQFRGFPVPDEKFAISVAGNQIRHVRGKVYATCVARHHVAFESLLTMPLKSVQHVKDHDVIVHGLTSKPFLIWRQDGERHGVHGRVGEVLEVDGNVPLPNAETFVVRRRHEPTVAVHKGDRVHRTQMPVVLLKVISMIRRTQSG
jgi:hypothetical protein